MNRMNQNGMDGAMMMSGWMWLFMVLLTVVVIAAIVGGVFLLVRAFSRSSGSGRGTIDAGSSSALSILSERFARGDIDREEFENRRAILRL